MKTQLAMFAVAVLAAIPAARAGETGLAAIHDSAMTSGNRLCMTSHFHEGTGTGSSRKEAEEGAKQSWISFTAFEYGSDWGSYNIASAKTMNCSQSGSAWSCFTQAHPCRHAVGGKRALKRTARRAKSGDSAAD